MKKNRKRDLIIEYNLGQSSYSQLAKKYRITKSTVFRWVQASKGIKPKDYRAFAKDILILPEMVQEIRKDLPTEVNELRQQLEQEKLRVQLLTAMIEIAETELNIPIRKKSGTKP